MEKSTDLTQGSFRLVRIENRACHVEGPWSLAVSRDTRLTRVYLTLSVPEFPRNALPACLASPFPLHRARPHPRPLGTDLRTAARGLGRQRHQDRCAAGRLRRRTAGRPAPG